MNFENRRRLRVLIDFIITLSVMLFIGLTCSLWVIPVVFAYGWWNYYDGRTRLKLRMGRRNPHEVHY
jgi:hypothetical protein